VVPELLVVGHIAYDENKTQDGTETVLGGSAYYTAVGASLYSKDVAVISRVGSDFGIDDFKKIKRLDIDITGISQEAGNTARFFHEYNTDGSRSWKGNLGVCADFNPNDIPSKELYAGHTHVGTMPPRQQRQFMEYLKDKTVWFSIDSLEQYIEQWPGEVYETMILADMVFLNHSQHELFRRLREAGKSVVLKKGADGAEYFFDDEHISVPAPKVELVDPTGSGDVLAGAFSILLARDWDPQYALEEAVRAASLSVTDFGVDFLVDKIRYR
jgi:sugar/nucleoside kinase (ribokinase family)